ncbi:MAG: tRNA pseudouridine(55) synthase TruB [Firmicutes bacterium]|nr:tRNA pseudouridine(55) synthase TruB [Bacillota bacterium]
MNGILVIDKPKNLTSRDVVNEISRYFKTKKVGHTGTLDPLATGVLVICLGSYTKISELLVATDKEYEAEFIFGKLTDTLDITGNVIKEEEAIFSKEEIRKALQKMIGIYNQEVPIYSAVKVNGKKLYEYARNNEEVVLPKHEVNIKELELLDIQYNNNKTVIKVRCLVSKGTYIRALGNDIARKLNSIAIMSNLRRTKQGKFTLKDSYKLEDVLDGKYELLNVEDVLDYHKVEIPANLKEKIKNGAIIDNIYNEEYILFTENKKAKAIYKIYSKDITKLKPWKML